MVLEKKCLFIEELIADMSLLDLLTEIRPEFDFTQSDNFIEDGYLDSFDLIALVASMDRNYHISIKGTDIVPDNFCNIAAIRYLLKGYGIKDEI